MEWSGKWFFLVPRMPDHFFAAGARSRMAWPGMVSREGQQRSGPVGLGVLWMERGGTAAEARIGQGGAVRFGRTWQQRWGRYGLVSYGHHGRTGVADGVRRGVVFRGGEGVTRQGVAAPVWYGWNGLARSGLVGQGWV